MRSVNIFGKAHDIPEGIILDLDLISQFPLQTYESMWRKFIRPGDIVLDIGAYIGLISLHFALLGASVHALEGSPRNLPRLNRLVKTFPEYRIRTHGVAVSDKNETINTRFNDCLGREHPTQEVQYVVYDEYAAANGVPDPSFIKIDIEGMETIALKGMSRLIHEVRPVWQIECHKGLPFHYEGYAGYVSTEMGGFDFQEFERAGYLIYNKERKKVNFRNMVCFENYFFVPMREHV